MRAPSSLVAIALLAGLAACSSSETNDAVGTASPSVETTGLPSTADDTAPAGNTAAPTDTGRDTGADAGSEALPTVAGGSIDLADYAGQDLALWFWAPW